MKRRNTRTAAAAAVLALGAGLSFGAIAAGAPDSVQIAQAEATDIGTAIANYRQAQTDLATATAAGSDPTEAQAALDATSADLGRLCQMLGQSDIEACIAAVTAAPPVEVAPEPAAVPVEPPVVEVEQPPAVVAQPAVEEAPEPTPPPVAEEQPVEPVAAEPEPVPPVLTVVEPQIPSADQPSDMAAPLAPPALLLGAVSRYETSNAALANAIAQGDDTSGPFADATAAHDAIGQLCMQLGQSDTKTCLAGFGIELSPMVTIAAGTDQPTPAEATPAPVADTPLTDQTPVTTAIETPTSVEPTIEVNPAGTPIPRELSRAIASYEQANTQLSFTVVGTPDAEAAKATVQSSLAEIRTLCEQGGQPDFDACLAEYGIALTPMSVAMQEAPKPETTEAVAPEDIAPILDSAKDVQLSGAPLAAEPVQAEQAPAPVSDEAAQTGAIPESIPSIEATTGTRIAIQPQREQPAEAKVVDQSGLRIVFQFNNQLIIANQADSRLDYGATERYVEQLPYGRTRETIVRSDGSSLMTVYNRNGDILHRSHFDQYGNETVFSYVQEDYDQDLLNWRDPGMDLPPLRLAIPPEDYVLDAQRSSLDSLTGFLDSPPVEQVQRLYSIDEVKRSARLRDMVRRLEIGNLTFQSGAASIPPDQIGALSIVANAMLDLIDRNPAETFLIEGHTDAVGTDYANLILSDQRAYSVATALTEVFGVPPENIATQGYGERYLKVNTEAPERLNRRVTIRRITPLVAPAAG